MVPMNFIDLNNRMTLKTLNIRKILMLLNALKELLFKKICSITEIITMDPSKMLDLNERYS